MFNQIKNQEDIEVFLQKTNMLHDGHVIFVNYEDNGFKRTDDGGLMRMPCYAKLDIKVLVTSMSDTVVEIEFEGVERWKIKNTDMIFSTWLTITENGWTVWASDFCQGVADINTFNPEYCSFVIAQSMKWRIVKQ